MLLAAQVTSGIVALLHAYFLVLEMFLWQKPLGRKVFGHTADQARATAVLAKNQGLYNGFLVAGIVWGLWLSAQGAGHANDVLGFFLSCVVVAGAYGAATVNIRILYIQAVPAIVALSLMTFA